ncbi:pullulanase-associated domain-containing protein [Cognaticolwellia mytili]|uniref:pullulanase-associated domain-containing protein n=1 Tax=Cognaticolwellia mytili TaxID=1888913 RepID=UPI001301BC34|nr:pullulanase-associated domain-containing protein [Cognaticolwellia mytili]
MTSYKKQFTSVILALTVGVLSGCGGGSDDKIVIETPLFCKSPETINDAGNACELVITPCNYPEVANPETLLCEMNTEEWIDGSNGITMPEPVYIAGAGEVVYYYNIADASFDGWALHAWNNTDCDSYAAFDHPEGGTAWGVGIQPNGIDPNFGAYWVMDLVEAPTCANFIPYNFEGEIQTPDIQVTLSNTIDNPTGNFYVLEGNEDIVFPHPRTFESLVVPGGSTAPPLTCEAPLVLNEAGDECITDPTALETFDPEATTLYLKGGFNDWANDENFVFAYEDGIFIMVASLTASAEPYEFKVADANWSEPTSFGVADGEAEVVLGESKNLVVGEDVTVNMSITVASDANYQFYFDAKDPENPTLTVTEVVYNKVMYVRGSLNDWTATSAMAYQGDNIYESTYTLEATDYEFKVADAAWTEATNFGAAAGNEAISLEAEKSLVFGEGVAMNITMTIAEAGNYKFVLDATLPEAPVLTVSNAVPYGSFELYMKGSMNGWTQTEGYGFSYADNHYTLVTLLDAASHEFKIAPDGWEDEATIGGFPDNNTIAVDTALNVAVKNDGGTENLAFAIDTAKMFSFDVDATDKSAPTLLVSEYIPFEARPMLLKGSMNGWSNDDAYEFTYEAGIFTLETTLEAAAHEFKIASADWEDNSTIGALPEASVVTVDSPLTVAIKDNGGADNLMLTVDTTTTYIFTVDATTVGAPVLTVSVKP